MTGNGEFHLHLISDSTGETLHALANAASRSRPVRTNTEKWIVAGVSCWNGARAARASACNVSPVESEIRWRWNSPLPVMGSFWNVFHPDGFRLDALFLGPTQFPSRRMNPFGRKLLLRLGQFCPEPRA